MSGHHQGRISAFQINTHFGKKEMLLIQIPRCKHVSLTLASNS